jgi:histidine triad (HIT) family protein
MFDRSDGSGVISPVVQAVLDAALAWDDVRTGRIGSGPPWAAKQLAAAVAVYRATLTPTCPECGGDGIEPGIPRERNDSCSACGGSGVTPNPRPHDPFDDGTTIYSEPLNASKPLGRP